VNISTAICYVPHVINRKELEERAGEGHNKIQFLMLNYVDSSTFIILMQSINYDNLNQKGWNKGIEAYSIFYHSLPADANVHLYLHSFESYLG